ncbi:hypothetical protein HX099_06545 [Thiopseudomonas alkaliphila]|uniref:Arsenate reductase n=1 Tax=Thiopseudomonas alkaliphila TaxID=1697053 RepID=A0AAW7DQA3_9GAMM|nr:ArsC/Spx/MgsR family protein [Thiopseudomonas alkaliphila]MDM1696319.1 hypothetical protein [Thiopseudomonas alkaliphila]MDM1708421.1 hypothetical protein [Thiopseudomonas alkaliphila]
MAKIILYHDPKSSVSRAALVYLEQQRYQVKVVRYLEQPLTVGKLSSIVQRLALPAVQLVNQELLAKIKMPYERLVQLPDEQIINLIAEHPQLLAYPILVVDKEAVLATSQQNMLRILPMRVYEYSNKVILLSY